MKFINKKKNPLVGEPGVGKTAIVEGLAQRIVSGLVPDSVRDKRVVVLDIPTVLLHQSAEFLLLKEKASEYWT